MPTDWEVRALRLANEVAKEWSHRYSKADVRLEPAHTDTLTIYFDKIGGGQVMIELIHASRTDNEIKTEIRRLLNEADPRN